MLVVVTEAEKHAVSTTLGRVYQELKQSCKESPVQLQHFDKILSHVENSVKACYQQTHVTDIDRKKAEEQLLLQAEVPPILMSSILQLLYQVISPLKEEIDEAKLFFLDTSDLALTDDNYSKSVNRKRPIDLLTKLPVQNSAKLKRCTRCGSLSEDIMPVRSPLGQVLFMLGQYCVCGSSWAALDDEDRQTLCQGQL